MFRLDKIGIFAVPWLLLAALAVPAFADCPGGPGSQCGTRRPMRANEIAPGRVSRPGIFGVFRRR